MHNMMRWRPNKWQSATLDSIVATTAIASPAADGSPPSRIRVIHHVYKTSYKNAPSSGFGDFIRGTFFLMEFCHQYGVELKTHLHDTHLKPYLAHFANQPALPSAIADSIERFDKHNWEFVEEEPLHTIDYRQLPQNVEHEFLLFLLNAPRFNGHVFLSTILFPSHDLADVHLDHMRRLLTPIDSLRANVEDCMRRLQLAPKQFVTIHIRLGDEYLNNQQSPIKWELFHRIVRRLTPHLADACLIIADSVVIKQLLKRWRPSVRVLADSGLSHTVDNCAQDIPHTLMDFYLMSHSKAIVSFSVYQHGSGFSKWCATTYGIPYVCYSLQKK